MNPGGWVVAEKQFHYAWPKSTLFSSGWSTETYSLAGGHGCNSSAGVQHHDDASLIFLFFVFWISLLVFRNSFQGIPSCFEHSTPLLSRGF